MEENMQKLLNEFERIKSKGYIKGIYNSNSSIGRTFENELGLEMNKECVPDYNGIEIKTRRAYTKFMITLFSTVPDGEEPLELTRLRDTYGYPYYKDRNYKCIYIEVFGNKLNFGGRYYQYKMMVDDKDEKVYLCIYNLNGKLIEKKIWWSFNYLKQKLETKLNYLALIHAWTNKVDNWNYFKYFNITFYKLKSFNAFLNLIKKGKIKLQIKIDIYLDPANYGKMYDHGCSFQITEDNLFCLFDVIDINKNR